MRDGDKSRVVFKALETVSGCGGQLLTEGWGNPNHKTQRKRSLHGGKAPDEYISWDPRNGLLQHVPMVGCIIYRYVRHLVADGICKINMPTWLER